MVCSGPRVRLGGFVGRQLGPQELGGPDDAVGWLRDQSPVGGDVGDPAVFAGMPSSGGAGGAGKLVVERLAGHDLPGAAGRRQTHYRSAGSASHQATTLVTKLPTISAATCVRPASRTVTNCDWQVNCPRAVGPRPPVPLAGRSRIAPLGHATWSRRPRSAPKIGHACSQNRAIRTTSTSQWLRIARLTCDFMVGVAGFEPAASSSRTKRAAKLRYTPRPLRSLADGTRWRALSRPARPASAATPPDGSRTGTAPTVRCPGLRTRSAMGAEGHRSRPRDACAGPSPGHGRCRSW
jgi:hypothetical protein